MSTAIKIPSIEDLVAQLADVRQALTEERARLVDRIAVIDNALGVTPVVAPSKVKAPKGKTRDPESPGAPLPGGLKKHITMFLETSPGSTIKEIQKSFEGYVKPSTVESTVRAMAADGSLTKDDQTPRHFSLVSKTRAA